MVKRILFVCGHNAGRSQMAQALFNHLNTNSEFVAESAGTNIGSSVNKQCVKALQENGIDMSDSSQFFPKKIDMSKQYEKVISMGCNVKCDLPIDEDFGLDDPHEQSLESVKKIRDQLQGKIQKLVETLV